MLFFSKDIAHKMDTSKIQILLRNKINEAVLGLVNMNSDNVSDYKRCQGIIHGLETAFSIVRSLDAEEREEDDDV